MDIQDEKNPLNIETNTSTTISSNFRNSVGRPTKRNEILFSAPPKSIISLLLSEEKEKKNKELQSDTINDKHNKTEEHQRDTNEVDSVKKNKRIKKWTCEYCSERIFYKKREYKDHLLIHNVYKCDYPNCCYSTKFTSNLKTHKRIHTSDFPYVCDECTFRTKFINSLKTHKRLHKTERPFRCPHCEYKCNSVSNLKKHCTRKHPNTPSDILN